MPYTIEVTADAELDLDWLDLFATEMKLAMARTDQKAPARSKTPVFDAMLEEARRAPRETDLSLEELDRRMAITEEERQAAQVHVDRWLREDAEAEAEGP